MRVTVHLGSDPAHDAAWQAIHTLVAAMPELGRDPNVRFESLLVLASDLAAPMRDYIGNHMRPPPASNDNPKKHARPKRP